MNKLKRFFIDHSYYSLKMFLYQFGMAMMGVTLSLVFYKVENRAGQLAASIGVVLFYLFLLYYVSWQVGDEDRRAAASGRIAENPLRGLYISLLANSLNIIFAVLNLIGLHGFGTAAFVLEGMYMGILMQPYGDSHLSDTWWMYFLIVIPALVVSSLGYYLGTRNVYMSPLFYPNNPEKTRRKK